MPGCSKRYLAPSLSIFIYLLICFSFAVHTAGLEEDEAISFRRSAALADHVRIQCLGGYDIRLGRACLPVMLAPYVGAPKDYVLLPLFWVMGVHVAVARMGAALLAALGIFGSWFFVNRFFGGTAAGVTAGFLALNPSYIDLPLFDQGNIAFSLAILGLLLIGVTQVADRPSQVRFFALGLGIGLGVWGRLNFIWLVLAAGVAVVAVLRRETIRVRRYLPALLAGSLLGGALLVRFLWRRGGDLRSFMESSGTAESLRQSVHSVFLTLRDVILASAEHRVAIWRGEPLPVWMSTVMLALSAIAVAWCCFRACKTARTVAGTIVLLLAAYLASRLPVSGHHLVIFLPLTALALGIAVADARFTGLGQIAIAILCAAYVITAATIDFESARNLRRTRGYGEWSAGIYSLVSYLQAHPDANGLYLLDWGFEHSVSVLSKGSLAGTSLFEKPVDDWQAVLNRGGTFVTYATEGLHFPEATFLFEQALERSKKHSSKTSFMERDSSPYAYVFVVPPSAPTEDFSPPVPGVGKTSFLASPSEIVSQNGELGETTLMFWTDKSKFVEIHVGAPAGPLLGQFRSRGSTSGVAKTGKWVSDGMTFYLQDVAGKPLAADYTLATVRVSVRRAK